MATLLLAIFGCGLAAAEDIPLPRPRPTFWAEPHSFREAAGPDFNTAEVTANPTPCDYRVAKFAVIAPIPRLIGPGACGGRDMVALEAVLACRRRACRNQAGAGADLRDGGDLRELAARGRRAAPDQARPELHSVENYDDYECRPRNRVIGAKLEQSRQRHRHRRSLVPRWPTAGVLGLTDVTVSKDLRLFLRASACQRFTTVLGPGATAITTATSISTRTSAINGYRICQWDVREPPPVEIASTQSLANMCRCRCRGRRRPYAR